MRAELRELKSKPVPPISSTSSPSETTTSKKSSLHSEYRGLGKRFAVLSELWVRRSALRQPCPIDLQTLGPWHPSRCANDAAWDGGIVSELYYLLPSSHHELIEKSALFSEEVCIFFRQTFIRSKPHPSSL